MSRSDSKKDWKHYFSITPYRRVFELAKTPEREEFSKNAILVTATVLSVGVIGYIIFTLMEFIPM